MIKIKKLKIKKNNMICKNCDNKLASEAKFCNKCGKPVQLEKEIVDIEYFSIPLKRLALLSVLTFGIYEIFWFYKNWEAIKKAEQQKISPLGRAIFTVFYCYDFFKKVLQSAKKNNYSDSYSPGLLALVYIVLLLVGNGLSKIENTTFVFNILWLLIATLSFIPLLSVQKAINFNNSKVVSNFDKNRKFSKGEIILTVIGTIWFGLVMLGTFSSLIPDSYNSSQSNNSTTNSDNLSTDDFVQVRNNQAKILDSDGRNKCVMWTIYNSEVGAYYWDKESSQLSFASKVRQVDGLYFNTRDEAVENCMAAFK
jgi:hypothetical protein